MRAVFSYSKLQFNQYRGIALSLFGLVATIALVIYVMLRFCLYGDEISLLNEAIVFMKMISVCVFITLGVVFFLWLIETLESLWRSGIQGMKVTNFHVESNGELRMQTKNRRQLWESRRKEDALAANLS